MKKVLLFFVALFAAINVNAVETTVEWTPKQAADLGLIKNKKAVVQIPCGLELVFDFSSGIGAEPTYTAKDKAIIINEGNTLTVNSTRGAISKIVLSFVSTPEKNFVALQGSFDNTTHTWTGAEKAVGLSYGADGGTSTMLTGVKVTFDDNALTLAEAKSMTVTSTNRNNEYIITDKALVTGIIGPNCYVEADGIGMIVTGINAAVGDSITNVIGKVTKASFAKNTFTATSATSYTLISSDNEVTPLEVSRFDVKAKADELDARLIKISRVAIDESASSAGNFLMTVNADKNDTGMSLSINETKEYVPVATIEGYVNVRTGSMAAMSGIMVKDIAGPAANEISLAEAKTMAVTSANRNTEYIIYDKALVTGIIGSDCYVYVEDNGVGMKITGINANVAVGDIITDIEGKLTKVYSGRNFINATSCKVLSSDNEVDPLYPSKDGIADLAAHVDIDWRLLEFTGVAVAESAASNGNFKMTINADQNDTKMALSITGTTVPYVRIVKFQGYVNPLMATMRNIMVMNIVGDVRAFADELKQQWADAQSEIAQRYPQAMDKSEFKTAYDKLANDVPKLLSFINSAADADLDADWKNLCDAIKSDSIDIEHLLFLIDVYETEDALAELEENFENITSDHVLSILINYDESLVAKRDEIAEGIEEVEELLKQCKETGEPTPDELKDRIAELSDALDQLAADAMELYPTEAGAYAPIVVEMMGFETMTKKLNERDGEIRGDLKLTNLWNRVMDQVAAENNRLLWDIENNPEPSDLRLDFHYTNVALIYASFAIYDEAVKQHLTKDEKIQAIFDAILNLVSSRNKIAAQYGPVLDDNAEWQALSARLDAEEAAVNALEGTDPSIEVLEAHETEIAAINEAMQAFATKMASDPTAISSAVKAESTVNGVYNLAGQKVSSNFKGIVVKNGKKVMVK